MVFSDGFGDRYHFKSRPMMTPSRTEKTPARMDHLRRVKFNLCCAILSRRRHSLSIRMFSRGFPSNPSWTFAKSSSDISRYFSESFINPSITATTPAVHVVQLNKPIAARSRRISTFYQVCVKTSLADKHRRFRSLSQ